MLCIIHILYSCSIKTSFARPWTIVCLPNHIACMLNPDDKILASSNPCGQPITKQIFFQRGKELTRSLVVLSMEVILSRMIWSYHLLCFSNQTRTVSVSVFFANSLWSALEGFRLIRVRFFCNLLRYSAMAESKCLSESERERIVYKSIDFKI